MHKIWNRSLDKLSGNLTTNEYMPERLKASLLEENHKLAEEFILEEIKFPKLKSKGAQLQGFDVLSGLQKLKKPNHLTVFRAIRFPTAKRMFEMIYQKGYTMPNFEQDRILELYQNPEYIKRRKEIKKEHNFWVQPQERVVDGLPAFRLVNDAIQIHHAFRHKIDKVLVVAMYIPYQLLKTKKVQLIANSAIDLDYRNNERDFEIRDYVLDNGVVKIDLESLRVRGIDLHEMYFKNLPWGIEDCEECGIVQDCFLLDIYEMENSKELIRLYQDTGTLLKYSYFLHGFFGDQCIFARRPSKFLPSKCYKIKKRKHRMFRKAPDTCKR